jgi:hypothetical protein
MGMLSLHRDFFKYRKTIKMVLFFKKVQRGKPDDPSAPKLRMYRRYSEIRISAQAHHDVLYEYIPMYITGREWKKHSCYEKKGQHNNYSLLQFKYQSPVKNNI